MISGRKLWPEALLASTERGIHFNPADGLYAGAPRSLFEALETSAFRFPDKPAVVLENGETYTFAHLKAMSVDLAGKLSRCGFSGTSRIGLLLDNSIELFIALYAASRLGAVAIMLPGKLKTPALMELTELAQPDLIITEPERLGLFGQNSLCVRTFSDLQAIDSQGACLPEDKTAGECLALIMFTSGTSSTPKAVAITNDNIIQAAMTYERVFDLNEHDRLIFGVPLYHVTGVVAIIAQITLTGCTLYLQHRFDPERFLRWARAVQATYIHASPTVFELMLRTWPEGLEIPSMRILACGAASMPSSRILRLKEKLPGAEFRTIYGLTETTSPASIFPVDAGTSELIGASGWVIPGVDLRIVDDNGIEVKEGEIGEIEVRGSTVCAGYIDSAGNIEQIEWLATGDLGFLNDHGFLYVVDRKKDQINRGGEKIYPHLVEEALISIDAVTDACVVGLTDELYGEIPAALYVVQQETSPQQIIDALSVHLASYSVPRLLLQVKEIPKTVGLKTDREASKRLLEQEFVETIPS